MEENGFSDIFKQAEPVDTTSIDRIFLTENQFEVLEVGSIAGSDTISDHPANFCKLRLLEY